MGVTETEVADVVKAFSRAAIDPREWKSALTLMNDTIGGVCCALECADMNTGQASMEITIPIDGDLLRLYEERVFHINPRVKMGRTVPVGVLADDRYLMPEGDPNSGEFLDWLDRTPYRYIQGAKLLEDKGHEIYFSTNFSSAHGPQDDVQDRVQRAVVPHLVNLVALGRDLSNGSLHNQIIGSEDLQRAQAFALLGMAGNVITASSGFEAVLRRCNLLGIRENRLVARHAQHRASMGRFLTAALGDRRWLDPPLPIRLTTPDHPRGLMLRATPIAANHDLFDIFRPAALITVVDMDAPRRIRRDELAAVFDLTQREADVAALIGEGSSAERVALELGISQYTIRQHLKAIFGKTGVSRQAELVAILARAF